MRISSLQLPQRFSVHSIGTWSIHLYSALKSNYNSTKCPILLQRVQLALKFVCLGLNLSIWPFKTPVVLLWFLAPDLKHVELQTKMFGRILNTCTKTLLELLELWTDAKILPCGLTCRKKGPQINSKHWENTVPVTRNPWRAQFQPELI